MASAAAEAEAVGNAAAAPGGVGPSAAAAGQLSSFEGFEVVEVLSDDPLTKSLALLGRFKGSDEQAVLLLSRKPFPTSATGGGGNSAEALPGLVGPGLRLQPDFANDIYSKYVGHPPPEHSAISVDLIYPATDKHVQKHRQQKRCMVVETPELYERIVLPYIQSLPPARIQWVYNILEKTKEAERLIFEDPDPNVGFMLHPDLKWDQAQLSQLYSLVLVRQRDLPCLRALRAEHVQLLENIRTKAVQAIEQRYGVPASCLRLFVHYYPSYFHFHVHIVHIDLPTPGAAVGKAVLLDDIIDNLKLFGSDFYQKRTLTVQLGEADELWRLLGPGGIAL